MKKFVFSISSLMILSFLSTGVSYASLPSSLTQPNTEGETAGTIALDGSYQPGTIVPLSDATGVVGGSLLEWQHNNVSFISNRTDPVHFVDGFGSFPNGVTATILDFSLDNVHKDNGYLLVDDQDVNGWVTALSGNSKYVSIYDKQEQTTMEDLNSGQSWQMDWLPQIAALCGAKILYKGGASNVVFQVNSNGNTGTPAFDVIPTPAPQASVSTQPSYSVGDSVPISLTAKLYAAATNWHMEAVSVTGPNGFQKYLPVNTGSNGLGAVADGTDFPYYGESGSGSGALATVYGGGSGDPSSPTVDNETATLDTFGLQPGKYNVSYTLYDAVGRAASNATDQNIPGTVSTSFTLAPGSSTPQPPSQTGTPPLSQPPGGPSVPVGASYPPVPTPPPAKSGASLNMMFPQANPIGINQYGTEPVKITNNSGQDVTTTLTAMIHTYLDIPYQYTYQSGTKQVQTGTDANGNPTYSSEPVYSTTTRYAMRAVTGTETKTLTVPAKKSVTWTIGNSMVDTIDGTSISFAGLTPGGPWIPHGATIPGSGASDTTDNNDGYCGDTNHMSSQIGIENGNAWVPNLVVTAKEAKNYLSPQIDEPILTFGLAPAYPVLPVISK